MQTEHRTDSGPASGLELALPGSLFDQAKHLLDPPPGYGRLAATRVANGAAVDGGAGTGLGALRLIWR